MKEADSKLLREADRPMVCSIILQCMPLFYG
jgi:hypothetical protein